MSDDRDREALGRRAREAHGDAWQVHGRLRARVGGGAAEVRGARLMASGIPLPQWNNADLTSADVDVEAMTRWYADRRVPWGVRVPLGLRVEIGRPLFHKRCAALEPGRVLAVSPPAAVVVRPATLEDLEVYVRADAEVFGDDPDLTRRWIAPALGAPGFLHLLAERDGRAIGVLTALRTDERAGPATYLTGLGARPGADADAVARALVAAAVEDAFAGGATLVHANPDDEERPLLAGLGFVEVPGFEVRLVVDAPA